MLRRAALVFAAASLVGPLIRLSTWPPSDFEQATSEATANFVYDLVFYLWPTQALMAYESSFGLFAAAIMSIGGNILFFLCFGYVVSVLSRSLAGLMLAYAGTCGLLAVMASWASGFGTDQVNFAAVLAALGVYGFAIGLVGLASRHHS